MPVGCVVAALGTKKENRLFDDESSDASSLIDAARALKIRVIVYSHTACKAENRWMALACEDAGADAVVCSRDSLRDCVTSMLACESMSRMKSDDSDETEHLKARAPSPTDDKSWVDSYPPLRRRRARDEFLQRKLGRTWCSSARVGLVGVASRQCVREYQSRITPILVTFSYSPLVILPVDSFKNQYSNTNARTQVRIKSCTIRNVPRIS